MLLRSFLPVGQGAFYLETFQGKNGSKHVVYDCGSMTDKNIVKKIIETKFQQGEEIEALFISHLHEDHVNGIPFLVKHCVVKQIYFPLVSNKELMKNFLKCTEDVSEFTEEFLDNPYAAVERLERAEGHFPKLIGVKEYDATEDPASTISGNMTGVEMIESGINVVSRIIDEEATITEDKFFCWNYIPFNFRQDERGEELKKNLKKELSKNDSTGEKQKMLKKYLDDLDTKGLNEVFNDIWKNENEDADCTLQELVKKAYRAVQRDLNTNSMTLYSGGEKYCRQFPRYAEGHNFYNGECDMAPVGCLYTGDYGASGKQKWRQLKNAYKSYWEQIGCVQVPHHGSKYSFNRELLDINSLHELWDRTYFVICAGKQSQYKHPHQSVINAFLLESIYPYIVTEDIESVVVFESP